MRAWFAIAVLITGLAGCATGVKDQDLAKVKRVGVISMLSDTFHVIYVGPTAFHNKSASTQVSDWQVDKVMADKTSTMLGAAGFESRAIDRSGLSPEDTQLTRSFVGGIELKGKGKILEQARRQGFDTMILVTPRISDNYRLFRPGYGFYKGASFFSSGQCVFMAYVVEVFAVDSGDRLAGGWGGGSDLPCDPGSDNDLTFKPAFDDYSLQEKEVLRQRLEKRMDATMSVTLSKLLLGDRAGMSVQDLLFGKPKAQ